MKKPKWLRYWELIRRVRAYLPKYHPKTGQYLEWNISIIKINLGYNERTGVGIGGYPVLRISPRAPSGFQSSERLIYEYDWHNRSLKENPLPCRWG